MPWAQTAATDDSIAQFLEQSRRAWEEGLGFGYAMRSPDSHDGREEGRCDAGILGCCGLHLPSGPGVVEIGYWVRTDRAGAGLATAAAGALTRAALELPDVKRIEIHCDAANRASRAIPAKLGYRLDRIEERAVEDAGPDRPEHDLASRRLSQAGHGQAADAGQAVRGIRRPRSAISCRIRPLPSGSSKVM